MGRGEPTSSHQTAHKDKKIGLNPSGLLVILLVTYLLLVGPLFVLCVDVVNLLMTMLPDPLHLPAVGVAFCAMALSVVLAAKLLIARLKRLL